MNWVCNDYCGSELTWALARMPLMASNQPPVGVSSRQSLGESIRWITMRASQCVGLESV